MGINKFVIDIEKIIRRMQKKRFFSCHELFKMFQESKSNTVNQIVFFSTEDEFVEYSRDYCNADVPPVDYLDKF